MRCFGLKVAASCIFGVLIAALGRAESLTIFASSDGKTGAVLTTTDRSASGGGFKGTGSIVFKLAGITLPPIGPMPYSGLMVSGSQVTGGILTTSKDEKVGNVFGSGLDLILTKGSSMSLAGNPLTLTLSGAASIVAPFKDSDGNSLKATVSQFSINAQGAASGKASLSISKPLELPGVAITTGTFNLAFTVPAGGSPSLSWNCPTASVQISLPGVTANDEHGIGLQATNVAFDADGLLSFSATYNGPQPISLSLAQPSNFALNITYANVTMVKSSITAGEFKGSLTLPPMFSSTDKGSGTADPVTIKDIDVKVDPSGAVVSAGTGEVKLYWNGFLLDIPAAGGTPNFILDLSDKLAVTGETSTDGTALPASWEGLYIKSANLTLPASFGGGVTIAVQNLLVESGGLSGKFTASGPALKNLSPEGFPVTANSLSLTFLKSQVAAFDADGTISIGGDVGKVGVKIGCSESGVCSLSVSQTTPVPLGPLGINLQIDQGTVTYDPKGASSIKITGSLSVPENAGGALAFLKGAAFAVKDLSVDTTGKVSISSAWLDLPHPVSVDLGPVNLVLNQIGIGQTNGQLSVTLTGDVSITELPISGQIGFKGLTISAGAVDIGGISLKVGIPDVLTISAEIENDTFDGNRDAPKQPAWHNKTESIFKGGASLELDCFGPSAPFGGSLQFMVAKTGWYVIGTADIGTGIQLGPTGFSIFGFEGGIGHNVEPDDPSKQDGVPVRDYNLIPYAPGQTGTEWMLMAGVRLGTADYFTAWGDIILSLMFGDSLVFDLNGQIELLQSPAGYPMGAKNLPTDRIISADINYNAPQSTFHAAVSADISFPVKGIIEAKGSMDFLISPNDKHFHIGGPVGTLPPPPGSPPDIQNPITVIVVGIQGPEAALDVDLTDSNVSFTTALITGGSLNESIDCGVFSVGIKAALQQWIYAAGSFNLKPSFGLNYAKIGLGITASVDLNFSCFLGSADIGAGISGDLNGSMDSKYNISVSGDLDVNAHVCGCNVDVPIHFQLP